MNSVFGDRRTIFILLGPALVLYTLLKVAPVMWSFGLSFFEGNTLRGFEWVGFENFTTFFTDDAALQSVGVSVGFAIAATVGQVAVALLFRSFVAVGDNQGPVNDLINFFGGESVEVLASTFGTMLTAIVMTLWSSMGFYAILLYAGLLDIPEEVIESARLDGANGLKLVRHIIVPLSLPILLSSIIFSLNATLKVFDSLLALNGGGPGTSTAPLTLYMYRTSFEYAEYGYGSTIALVLTLLCLVFTLAIFRTSRQKVED